MIKLISLNIEDIKQYLAISPFRYDCYSAEFEKMSNEGYGPEGPRYLGVDSSTVAFRPRNEWNTLGRAIWNSDQLALHARLAANIIEQFGDYNFVVQHKGSAGVWFPLSVYGGPLVASKIEFLRRNGVHVDLNTWVGGFLLKESPRTFFEHFLDYSHLLHLRPIEMLCLELPLLLRLDYDLEINWISPDRDFLIQLTKKLLECKILTVSNPYLP